MPPPPPPPVVVVQGPVRRPDGTLIVPAHAWAVLTAASPAAFQAACGTGEVLAVCPTEQAAELRAREILFAGREPEPPPPAGDEFDDLFDGLDDLFQDDDLPPGAEVAEGAEPPAA